MNFINLNCPPLPYFIVGGGCVYRPGDIHERRTIRNVFDLIYVHSGTLYLEQDPFRVELNAGQFFIITPDTPHRGSRVCQEKTTTSWVHFYTNGKYSLSDDRLFISTGFLSTKEDEVRLYRIMDISLKRTLGQRIFGLGTIKCCSADKTLGDFEIKNIKKSKDVKELLSEMVENERNRKKVTSREFIDHEDSEFDDGHDDM